MTQGLCAPCGAQRPPYLCLRGTSAQGRKVMSTMAEWLASLGMSEYAQRFAENGIDVSALRHLTDQDLKDIGVLLGHRRKMLAAIGELTGAAPENPVLASGMEPKTQDTAERRQVTVMFSDLVGSTALSARMDPEDIGCVSSETARSRMTHQRHWLCTAAMVLIPVSASIEVLV
jgi:uncharacterized protein YjiS (DUF1127 family)